MEKPDRVFEVSWEVCNKVGGINTVIKSKAPFMVEHYDGSFTMIGPYIEAKAAVDLEKKPVPKRYQTLFAHMKERGIECYYGVWSIVGEPEVILLDFQKLIPQKNEIKARYWERFKVDSLNAHWDFEEPMLFSTAAGMLIEEYEKIMSKERIIVHCHEWMTGFTLLHLKMENCRSKTVFTTHATMLGRAVAGSGYPLYKMIDSMNPEEWAYKMGVQDKFTAERACAHEATIFTTVSEITALEAEKLLGRKPEVLLFNGMSLSSSPTVEETSTKHVKSRELIREFLAYYFYPYYTFNLEHSLIYFITARYEFKNKGLDILIEALAKLNEQLKKENDDRTVICFFWIPMATRRVRTDIIENKNFYNHIKNYIDWHSQSILKQITFDFMCAGARGKSTELALPDTESLFSPEFIKEMKRDMQHFKREGNPPICTHELYDQNDALYHGLQNAGLNNGPDDRVKVIMYPAYLDGADGLMNLPYYEAIVGGHLGIFPSYYEPWGYTPVEAASLAVPAITTDLAGFGRFIQQHQHKEQKGIFVLPRLGQSREAEVEGLYHFMYEYSKLDHVERVQNRLVAKQLSSLSDWQHFVKHYIRAHTLALNSKK